MKTKSMKASLLAIFAVSALALTGCTAGDPLASDDGAVLDETIVVGSQDYYSNEIIAEIYAQALEAEGYTVDRQFRIGQREVYLPEIEAGKIDLLPEYTGNLLQYWNEDAAARLSDEVYAELVDATPEGLRVLQQAEASDQDSYTVTRDFATKWQLESIADLANVTDPLVLGSNSEAETRPYGPAGMMSAYGVEIEFTPIEDAGGPLTVKALVDGTIQLANIYTADPSIASNDLVPLKDTEGLFLASHVVPLASENVSVEAAEVIDAVSAKLGQADLVSLNKRSIDEELSAQVIAADWLESTGF